MRLRAELVLVQDQPEGGATLLKELLAWETPVSLSDHS